MKLFQFLLCICFFFCSAALSAQKSFSPELSFQYGKVIKHTSVLRYEEPQFGYGITCNLKSQTYGNKEWHQFHRYPQLGVALSFYDLGNRSQLGYAFGVRPNITLYMKRKPTFNSYFNIGAGLAYLNKIFHPIDNPNNNAIGSHINAMIAFGFGLSWDFKPPWKLNAGFGLTHYSNGAGALPNFGLNFPRINIGLQYTPGLNYPTDYLRSEVDKKINSRRFGWTAYTAIGFRESISIGGPHYPIYIASAAGTYRFNKVNRLLAGFEYEFNTVAYRFGKHTYSFTSEKDARRKSSRVLFFLADEFLFGQWSIQIQAGIYVSRSNILKNTLIYNKIGLRYYLPKMGRSGSQIYTGVFLKSHISVAEYFSFAVGMAL